MSEQANDGGTSNGKVAVPEERNARRANTVDGHVGARVRLRRMLLGMSQEKLGECLGLTFQQVQKYEKGVNRIGASRLFDLAHVLGVPVQFFYDEIDSSGHNGHKAMAVLLSVRPKRMWWIF